MNRKTGKVFGGEHEAIKAVLSGLGAGCICKISGIEEKTDHCAVEEETMEGGARYL